jgi:hypothetical protein
VDAPAHTTLMLVDAPHPVVDTQVMAEQVLRGQ